MATGSVGDFPGMERILKRLAAIATLDFTPLVERWARRLVDDNARFALAGLDCDEKSMETTVREWNARVARRLGAGKPIDPKGRQSRIITMAQAAGFKGADDTYFAQLAWPGFTDKNGSGILGHLRAGVTRKPRPGLRGGLVQRDVLSRVRPSTMTGAVSDLHKFIQESLKKT